VIYGLLEQQKRVKKVTPSSGGEVPQRLLDKKTIMPEDDDQQHIETKAPKCF